SLIDKMIYKLRVSASPNEIWVDENFRAGGHNRGHTWGYDAFSRIQDGVNALSFWGKVNVAPGTYNENIKFRGVPMRLESESGPQNTTIHGNGRDTVVLGSIGSTLKGFTITGGSSPYLHYGIEIRTAAMTITGNIIRDSSIGIYMGYGQRPIITNNVIRNNQYFGVYAVRDAAPIVANNTIVFNGESGIHLEQGRGLIVNNIVYWNSGYGISCDSQTGSLDIRHNNVFENKSGNYYLCGPGKGDISLEPHLLNLERLLHLKPMSPCLGAGILTPEVPRIDFDGNPRPIPEGSNPDIGAYEHGEVYKLILDTGGEGTTKPPPEPYKVFSGIELKITAIPDKGSAFSHWSGDVDDEDKRSNPLVFVMDSDKWIKANFARDFWLRVTAGKGGTTDPAPGKHFYDVGAEVSVTAMPKEGYRFVQWQGDISNSQNPLKLTMYMNVKIKAQFSKQCVLSVACGEGGTVQPGLGEHSFDRGTTVKLTAAPDLHYQFSGWSGALSHAQNPCEYTVWGDSSVTAHFLRKIYAPDNCGGRRVENRALFIAEYLDVLSWQPHPDNVDITKYRVYIQEGDSLVLLSEVGADVFQYQHRATSSDAQCTYAVVAVNSEDRLGELAFITVNGK
ncbi:MAG: right-handed parallel beta-helix repeat-containing protein, partial [Candidatus Aminicenantaceae bacterium]